MLTTLAISDSSRTFYQCLYPRFSHDTSTFLLIPEYILLAEHNKICVYLISFAFAKKNRQNRLSTCRFTHLFELPFWWQFLFSAPVMRSKALWKTHQIRSGKKRFNSIIYPPRPWVNILVKKSHLTRFSRVFFFPVYFFSSNDHPHWTSGLPQK